MARVDVETGSGESLFELGALFGPVAANPGPSGGMGYVEHVGGLVEQRVVAVHELRPVECGAGFVAVLAVQMFLAGQVELVEFGGDRVDGVHRGSPLVGRRLGR